MLQLNVFYYQPLGKFVFLHFSVSLREHLVIVPEAKVPTSVHWT